MCHRVQLSFFERGSGMTPIAGARAELPCVDPRSCVAGIRGPNTVVCALIPVSATEQLPLIWIKRTGPGTAMLISASKRVPAPFASTVSSAGGSSLIDQQRA